MSDNNPWNDPPSASPTPLRKQGMSGCMLAGLIVGGLGLVCVLVCCGVCVWIVRMFMPNETKVPVDVAAVARKILNIEIPPDFSPDVAETVDNMFLTARFAKFNHKEGKGLMAIGRLKINMGGANQMNNPAIQSRDKYDIEILGPLDIKKTESKDITVNGQKVSVSIGEGTDRATGKPVHTASADFQEANGLTFFRLRMDDDVWNEEAILKMLEDAKAP